MAAVMPYSDDVARTFWRHEPSCALFSDDSLRRYCRTRTHDFFSNKRAFSASLEDQLRAALRPYVQVVAVQVHRILVPPVFEDAMLHTVITRISILEAERFYAAKAVEFQIQTLAARYSAVQTVAQARGAAAQAAQRGRANAQMLAATVAREIDAFANVSNEVSATGPSVTPHEVLDYAYWQLVLTEPTGPLGSGRHCTTYC